MELAEQALGITPTPSMLEELHRAATEAGVGTDRPLAALYDIRSWAASRQHAFDGRLPQVQHRDFIDDRAPSQYLGAWKQKDDTIAFLPTALRGALDDLGYEPEAVLTSWHQRGWLKCPADKGRQWPVTVGGLQTKCIVVLGTAGSAPPPPERSPGEDDE